MALLDNGFNRVDSKFGSIDVEDGGLVDVVDDVVVSNVGVEVLSEFVSLPLDIISVLTIVSFSSMMVTSLPGMADIGFTLSPAFSLQGEKRVLLSEFLT